MNERLKDYLEHGEDIIWNSRPESFEAMDKTHKSYYIRRSIIALIVSVALICIYIPAAISTGAGIKPGVLAVLIAVAIYAVLSPMLDVRQLRKVQYVLTNEKLMIVTPSDVRSVKLSAIPTARLETDADGHSSLLCGPDAVPAKKRRVATLTGAVLDQDSMMCDRFVMYAIENVQSLKKAAAGYLSIN